MKSFKVHCHVTFPPFEFDIIPIEYRCHENIKEKHETVVVHTGVPSDTIFFRRNHCKGSSSLRVCCSQEIATPRWLVPLLGCRRGSRELPVQVLHQEEPIHHALRWHSPTSLAS